MPKLACAIMEHTDHIFSPVINQIAHRLVDMLDLGRIIKDDSRIYIETDWATHSRTSTNENDMISDPNQFRVEASVQLNPTSQKWEAYTFHHTAAYGLSNQLINRTFPIYLDRENRVKIVELRTPVTIQFSCTVRTQSAVEAYRLPQILFNTFEAGSLVHFNDLVYDYQMPKPVLSILATMYGMDRTLGKPAGVSWYDYIQRSTESAWQLHTNRNIPGEYEIVVPCVDEQALGTLEYSDEKPQAQKQERLSAFYEINFNYYVQFGMPSMIVIQYPCVYDNQLLPARAIPQNTHVRHNRMPESHHAIAYERIKNLEEQQELEPGVLRIPFYDDWTIPTYPTVDKIGRDPIAIMGVLVDENESLLTTVDLADDSDPNYALKPVVKEILYQEGASAFENNALINITVYRGYTRLQEDELHIDDDLKLTFNARSVKDQYHVVISSINVLRECKLAHLWLVGKYYPWMSRTLYQQLRADAEEHWRFRKKPEVMVIGQDGNVYVPLESMEPGQAHDEPVQYSKITGETRLYTNARSGGWWVKYSSLADMDYPYANGKGILRGSALTKDPVTGELTYGHHSFTRVVSNHINTRRS